jgi:NAD(P)-dependent dehydrogenase (short-subunit alcohol dehydrogenase family)
MKCFAGFEEGLSMTRVWLVTGCSSGFGLELAKVIAQRCKEQGDRLIATSRAGAQSLAQIEQIAPGAVLSLALDVTKPEQVHGAVERAMSTFGQIDVLINNAGYGLIGAIEECDEQQIARNFATNFFGPLQLMQKVMPIMRQQQRGHIINMSAAAAISNYAGFGIYGAAKCALEGLSEAAALELAPHQVKVTIVQPGPFRTEFIQRSMDKASKPTGAYEGTSGKFAKLLSTMSGKQPGDPGKAARLIVSMVDEVNPPLRLVLGKYAVNKVRTSLAKKQTELERFEQVGMATEF